MKTGEPIDAQQTLVDSIVRQERVIEVNRVLRGGKVGFEASSEGVIARGKDMDEAMANLRLALKRFG